MANRNTVFALLIPLALLAAAPVLADDPVKDVIDREVPTMKDGTRMAMSEIERSILDA